MNVNISEKIESKLKDLAIRNGKAVEDFAGVLLEEKTEEIIKTQPRKKKLSDLAGLFYGGDGKTSENAAEILMSEIDKTSGFGR
ncbi:MAG: hypothetical protein LH614_05395 [Pyrinomonadaceae bacterium]|nr:hypothetical protein [Pyrinomonadaceae bacterium]